MKYITLLGATGSVGIQTVDVVKGHPDKFRLVSMSVGKNINKAREIITALKPEFVSTLEKSAAEELQLEFSDIQFSYGDQGLTEAAIYEKSDIVVNAVLGSVGLSPTLEAIKRKKPIALANKETLVTAGHLVMDTARRYSVPIIPVDSEHSAIFQVLQGENRKNIEQLIITASGGSFRDRTREELENVTIAEALHHPNWSMGAKITIDSATMMNKGFEVIEAHWLFSVPYEQIAVLLHRESIIHSMVEFHDSSVIAQLGSPDMRVPIQYALTFPDRIALSQAKWLNLIEISTLHFEKMDFDRFRCLHYAYEAGKIGGTMPTVLNAANEVAVAAFLTGKIPFMHIEECIEDALSKHKPIAKPNLETILAADQETRNYVQKNLSQIKGQ
ncbi:1-deoxy-D-xylulose-5-phosphate reductoisomerase [Bacillaceae bacterium Marseille-Q3522]|nr:1-deoxy-D-xylulose-5-phosphate reductoisomerase [Bacillaceae bacterium Marseille-Q3522]